MSEKLVGKKLVVCSPRLLWKACSDKYGYGTPDRSVLVRGEGRVLWAELKHIGGLPMRSSKVPGFKPRQAQWLAEWKRNGGECYLIIGVGKDLVAIFDDRFIEICKFGLKRDEYKLLHYDQVERFLLYGEA